MIFFYFSIFKYVMIFECLGSFHLGFFFCGLFFFFLKAGLMAHGLQSCKLFTNVSSNLEEYIYALWKSEFGSLRL